MREGFYCERGLRRDIERPVDQNQIYLDKAGISQKCVFKIIQLSMM